MEGTKELTLTICEKIQSEYPKRPIWQTMLEIEDLIDKHVKKQLLINGVVVPKGTFNCIGGNFAKGIEPCDEWCGEDICQKPSN